MGLTEFLAKNKRSSEVIDYVVSDEMLDENGQPAVWKLKTIPASIDRSLRENCLQVVKNRHGQPVSQNFNQNKYLAMLVAKCVVEPDLNNSDLQDAYGVKTDWELVEALLTSGEFAKLLNKVQDINDYLPMDDKIDEAKN